MVTAEGYLAFADRLRASGWVSDPWFDGSPRFATDAVFISPTEHAALCRAAEDMAAVFDEMVRLLQRQPELMNGYFALDHACQAMWHCAAPRWHGIARADIFLTSAGPVFCELNADTPSGQAEATALAQLFADAGGRDPNADLQDRFCALVAYCGRSLKISQPPSVGIVYPTELTEDLGLIALYRSWLEARGLRVTLGSPFNLTARSDGGAALLGVPCDVFIRHYKTDWWASRQPAWLDQPPPPDAEPLRNELAVLLHAELAGKAVVINPFGAVVPQNKRALAFLCEEKARLSPTARRTIARYLPETRRLELLDRERLSRERGQWVLKSDYGCEGEETVVGAVCTQEIWDQSLAQAAPGRWVAQRYFEAVRDSAGRVCNHGVYLVAGAAAGLYARLSAGPTDVTALSAAVRIRRG